MYVYKSDVWCNPCGEHLCSDLGEETTCEDSDVYPQGPVDDEHEEGDHIYYCCSCGEELAHKLTEEGRIETIKSLMDEGSSEMRTLLSKVSMALEETDSWFGQFIDCLPEKYFHRRYELYDGLIVLARRGGDGYV